MDGEAKEREGRKKEKASVSFDVLKDQRRKAVDSVVHGNQDKGQHIKQKCRGLVSEIRALWVDVNKKEKAYESTTPLR